MNFVLNALIRIEKKLDELLKLNIPMAQKSGVAVPMPQPLGMPNQGVCPLCQKGVTYQHLIDPETDTPVPVRVCGCEPVVVSVNETWRVS